MSLRTAFENCIPHRTLPRRYNQPEALSIQQKIPASSNFRNFRFPERNSRLRPNSRYRTFGYRTCKQDTEERYWAQRFSKCGKGTELADQFAPSSKVFPNIPVGPNRNDPFNLISNRNFRNFGLNGKHPTVPYNDMKVTCHWVICLILFCKNCHSLRISILIQKCILWVTQLTTYPITSQ